MCEHKDATEFTKKINEAVLGELPFDYTKDFEDAARGFVAPLRNGGKIEGAPDLLGDETDGLRLSLCGRAARHIADRKRLESRGSDALFRASFGQLERRAQGLVALDHVV